jgi:hypothetical protein
MPELLTAVSICPCCGRPKLNSEAEASLAPMERRLYQIVDQAGAPGISNPQCIAKLYAGDPRGIPRSSNIVAVMVSHLNRKIRPFGIAIRSKGGPGAVYRLIRLK